MKQQTKATIRYSWSRDGKRQNLFIDYYPAIINDDGKETRREMLHCTITPLLQANGAPKAAAKGLFPIKDPAGAKTGKFYTYSDTDNSLLEVLQAKVTEKQRRLNSMIGMTAAEREAMEIENRMKTPVAEFAEKLMATKEFSRKYCLKSTLNYLKQFAEFRGIDTLKFADLNKDFCEEFIPYLEKNTNLKPNSISIYGSALRQIIKSAYEKNYLMRDIHFKRKPLDMVSTRDHLTENEIQTLIETPCSDEELKRMFLFACMVGLRRSDCKRLKFGNIEQIDGIFYASIIMQKTNIPLKVPMSDAALYFVGKFGKPNELVFHLQNAKDTQDRHLKRWLQAAGITRHITFHCSRHSYAMFNLEHGAPLQNIQKALGHTDISTTQIYAKVSERAVQQMNDKMGSAFVLPSKD